MTREQEIEKAIYDYSKKIEKRMNGIDYFNYEHIEHAFIDGIEWADSHPIKHWISVEDDLPCNHDSMIREVCKCVDYETNRVLVLLMDGTIEISYMYRWMPYAWRWNTYKVTHWMPLPELPTKE